MTAEDDLEIEVFDSRTEQPNRTTKKESTMSNATTAAKIILPVVDGDTINIVSQDPADASKTKALIKGLTVEETVNLVEQLREAVEARVLYGLSYRSYASAFRAGVRAFRRVESTSEGSIDTEQDAYVAQMKNDPRAGDYANAWMDGWVNADFAPNEFLADRYGYTV